MIGSPERAYLFRKPSLYGVKEYQQKKMLEEIGQLPSALLLNGNTDEIASELAEKYSINVPKLNKSGIRGQQEPVQVDVSRDQTRAIFDRSRPLYMEGTRVVIFVPFEGDAALFEIRPDTFTSVLPMGRVVGQELQFTKEGVGITKEQLAKEKDGWLTQIEQYLEWHRKGLGGFNESLKGAALQAIEKRRQKLQADQNLLSDLGVPVGPAPGQTIASQVMPSPAAPRRAKTEAASPNPGNFDFFISYAGEDRAVVAELVPALERKGYAVWWDKGQITIGDRLSQKIDEGLRRSRFGVVIVSRAFIAKRWPDAELRALANRAVNSGHKVVLPVLVGITHNEFAEAYPILGDIVSATFTGDHAALVAEISAAVG